MTIPTSSIDQVIPGQGAMAQPEAAKPGKAAKRRKFRFVSNGKAMTGIVILGGTLLVEIVFSYPGLGFLLFRAVGAKDYPLMQGIFLCITIAVLVATLIADVIYLLLDPRTRKEG